MEGWGDALKTLSNGIVTYEENGRRKEIQVGKKCADLWVSPDESVVAFIAIHKSKPATPQEIEPFIQESSIYIARKSDHFKPVHLAVKGRTRWTKLESRERTQAGPRIARRSTFSSPIR
jgi:hypothetical protein